MVIEGADYFVHMVDFPVCSCGGAVLENADGTYTILINSRLSHAQNMRSILHELRHIDHEDFGRDAPVSVMEEEAGA